MTDQTPSPTGTPQKPTLLSRLLFMVFIALILLGSLEIGARWLTRSNNNPTLHRITVDYGRLVRHGADWIRFEPDPIRSYRLRPGFSLDAVRGTGRTVHNAEGYRDDEDFGSKKAGTLRICCFGGSTTYGVGVESNRQTYPEQLEIALADPARDAGWDRVEVFNLGVGGYNSREILATMTEMIPRLQPDIVLVQNAVNDVIPRLYPDFKADYSHFRTPFSPLELQWWHHVAYRSHAWLIVAHRLGWVRPLSLQSQTQPPMPPVDEALANLVANPTDAFRDNVRAEIAAAQQEKAQVWLITQAYLDIPAFAGPNAETRRLEGAYRNGLAEHIEVVIAVARETQVSVVPLHETMPRDQRYFTDPIHMSPAGNEAKAAEIAKAIGPHLPVKQP